MSSEANSTIRHATADDIPSMIALERESGFAAHWSEPAYRKAFAQDAPVRIALVFEDETVESQTKGFLLARITGDESELENIVVAGEYQRRGVGTQLMRSLIQATREHHALRILLEVRESNAAARRFYEKFGFQMTGRRLSYCSNPTEDALFYALALN